MLGQYQRMYSKVRVLRGAGCGVVCVGSVGCGRYL